MRPPRGIGAASTMEQPAQPDEEPVSEFGSEWTDSGKYFTLMIRDDEAYGKYCREIDRSLIKPNATSNRRMFSLPLLLF